MAGRVKTRLGKDIGMTAAAWWFRHQTASLLRRLRDPRWKIVLSVTPDTARHSPVWPAHFERHGQGAGDLGARMVRAMRNLPGPVVLIGGDIPGVERIHIAAAFRSLGRNATVLGPAVDGGFWLIGARHPSRLRSDQLEGIVWSQPTTLNDTAPRLPQPVGHVDTLSDVDTLRDLLALKGRDAMRPA